MSTLQWALLGWGLFSLGIGWRVGGVSGSTQRIASAIWIAAGVLAFVFVLGPTP